jgi:CheY-like chemotaxis protein
LDIAFESLKGLRILLVEDNKVNQFVAEQILGKWDVHVEIANHGAEALSMLENNHYHLVLMDLQMPVMDGLEATLAIRQSNSIAQRDVPIIALTADLMADTRQAVFDAGMNDIIVKPFELEDLYQKITVYKP